jgi:S1-C subfamily serine protease
VPSNTVQRVVPELIENGAVNYSWLGITSMREDNGLTLAGIAEPLELPVSQGVLVSTVTRGSPAAEAGIQGGDTLARVWGRDVCVGGDIIVAIDDTYIADMSELVSYLIFETVPGDTVTLLVVRENETLEMPVTLRERPTTSEQTGCGQ